MFNPIGSKATVCAFSYVPGRIVTGHMSGKVAVFDYKTGEEVDNNERAHGDEVTDLQMSPDRTYFITSSKDKAARVSDSPSRDRTSVEGRRSFVVYKSPIVSQLHQTKDLKVLKTYATETPLNSAAIAFNKPYVSRSNIKTPAPIPTSTQSTKLLPAHFLICTC